MRFDTPYGKEIKRFLAHGVGIHHAGLLPKYRLLVEKLAQKGLLAVISGTDTLGVGVNIPIRTVLLTRLCKFDGDKTAILGVREFKQIAGRAGRKGFDVRGDVIAQAPEHVIENLRLEQKAAGDPLKLKRLVRKKPPDKGYVHWDRGTFDRLVSAEPEALTSRFRVSHGMLLSVLERPDAGCLDVARIIHRAHERRAQRRIFGREAKAMIEALEAAGIVEIQPGSRKVRLHVDLQDDFSLHHALSLWLVDTVGALDAASPTYALDVLTLVESLLENPDYVLRQQLEASSGSSWVSSRRPGSSTSSGSRSSRSSSIRSRSVSSSTKRSTPSARPSLGARRRRSPQVDRARDGRALHGLQRVRARVRARSRRGHAPPVLQRRVQGPAADRSGPREDRGGRRDRGLSSRDHPLGRLELARRMGAPEARPFAAGQAAEPGALAERVEPDVTQDERAFTVLVRGAMFQMLRALARQDWAAAAALASAPRGPDATNEAGAGPADGDAWTADRFAQAMRPFFEEHASIRLDPSARAPDKLRVTPGPPGVWEVGQVISDSDDDNDWVLSSFVDLAASARDGKPVVVIRSISR